MITVHSRSRGLGAGDSITARRWSEATGGLCDTIGQRMPGKIFGSSGVGAVAASNGGGAVPGLNRGYQFLNTGINGQKTADVLAGIQSQIIQWAPDWLVLLIGVNDIAGRLAVATIEANYNSIMATVAAALPSCQIACCSILCYGEIWTLSGGVPVWNNGPTDTDLATVNSYIQNTICPTYGATYVDFRTPLLALQPSINPGQANNAFTTDGVHPIIQASEVTMGQWASASFQAAA